MSTVASGMPDEAAEAATDGRTLRAHRTRTAVVDALLSLIEDGDVRPTGPRIAERAGVSLRSVFQHFADLEALFAEASERQTVKILNMFTPLSDIGPLPQRIDAFVAQRSRIFEAISPVRRAARLQEPFSATLEEAHKGFVAICRHEAERIFRAELAGIPDPERRARCLQSLVAASAWTTWDALRVDQDLDVEAATAAFASLISAVLATASA